MDNFIREIGAGFGFGALPAVLFCFITEPAVGVATGGAMMAVLLPWILGAGFPGIKKAALLAVGGFLSGLILGLTLGAFV